MHRDTLTERVVDLSQEPVRCGSVAGLYDTAITHKRDRLISEVMLRGERDCAMKHRRVMPAAADIGQRVR
jgi:hypothetical protein